MALRDVLKTPSPEPPPSAPPCDETPRRRLLTPEDAECLRQLGLEVEIASPLGSIWIVPARTQADRVEMLPEDVVALVNFVRLFGGKVVGLTRNGKPLVDVTETAEVEELAPEPPADPDPQSAREHLRRLREQAAPAPTASPAPEPVQTNLFDTPRSV
jgi:hypothetical protein